MKRTIVLLLICMLTLSATAQRKRNRENRAMEQGMKRVEEVMSLVNKEYMEVPDMEKLSEAGVKKMLETLDPHSVYISAKDVAKASEALVGNFDGVGISFQIVDDTIRVMDVIIGGPSERVGLMRGDKLLKINGVVAVGDSIDNAWVPKYLRGEKGSKVDLEVMRGREVINFTVERGKVPIRAVESYFMADDSVGYIRLTKFSRTAVNEFEMAVYRLRNMGMSRLILDLRGNTGGYLDIACKLANDFLAKKSLIVYTEGRNSPRKNYWAGSRGVYREGELVVLIDEGSASASEIVSGAVQDCDRGMIVGRRSYGKGLVQRMYEMEDGAQVRLTTARYYTPSGRCIQRPYDGGLAQYRGEINERYRHGELVDEDSIHFADSLKYKTKLGRTVYGGGGIMPDVFVPMDTMRLADYFVTVRSKGMLTDWTFKWADAHRLMCVEMGYGDFMAKVESGEIGLRREFEAYAAEKGVVRDSAMEATMTERVRLTDEYMEVVLRALVAKDVFGSEYYYLVMKEVDEGYKKGLEIIRQMDKDWAIKKN